MVANVLLVWKKPLCNPLALFSRQIALKENGWSRLKPAPAFSFYYFLEPGFINST